MPLHSSAIPTFSIPSIDPPGVKRKLCPPYDLEPPFKRGKLTSEVIERVSTMNPLPSLHRSLIPDLDKRWKPPVFYYGWSIGDLLPRLLRFAEERDLIQYRHTGVVREAAPLWNDGNAPRSGWWAEDDEDEEEDEDEVVVDELISAQNSLRVMVREAGVCAHLLHRKHLPFRIRGILHQPSGLGISIYSNYELEHAVSEEDIKKVQKHLGIQEMPAWYVSDVNATWEIFTPRW